MRTTYLLTAVLLVAAGCAGCASGASGAGAGGGNAGPGTIKIGALYPLTGSSAATGERTLNGVQLAAQIVNGEHPDIGLPLADSAGLPNLGGRKVEIVSADHEGSPERGASEVERLVTGEGVVAIVGAYFSSVTDTASERAERLGIPFVNGASSSTALTEDRDLKYFFRTGPSDRVFGKAFFGFLGDVRDKLGQPIQGIDILYENTDYGTDAAAVTKELAQQNGFAVLQSVPHGNGVSDVTPEATLICSGPDVPLFEASYTPEAILFTRAFKNAGCTPTILAYGAGFSDAAYFKTVGNNGEYVISRAAWALDAVKDRPAAVAVSKAFQQEFGYPMDENSARTFTAAMTLFTAINEAGSTEPDAIRKALEGLNIPADQTIMPWDGVKFDESGQNVLARGIVLQHLDGQYRLVWPFETATAKLVWPAVPYSQR